MRNKIIFKRLNNRGFTLIELIIVVIILAVLASLALPVMFGQVERARRAEAIRILQDVRASQFRYYNEYGTFSTAFAKMDFNPTVATGVVQAPSHTYTLPAAAATTFTAKATSIKVAANTVTITEKGVLTYTGQYI